MFLPRASIRAFFVSLFLTAASFADPEISWVAIGADGPYALTGSNGVGDPTEIVLVAGVGYRVEFQMRLSGWADTPGQPTLGTYQGTLDEAGMLGANAVPPNPGVDLLFINESPYGALNGWYQQQKSCLRFDLTNTGQRCDTLVPPLPPCPPGTFCGDNPDAVFPPVILDPGFPTPGHVFGGASNAGQCRADAGGSYYAGTFKFDVPAGAVGRYTFGFDPALAASLLNNCAGTRIPGIVLTPGAVTIGSACCLPDRSCEVLDETDCLGAGGTVAGGLCDDDADGDGTADACDDCPDNPDLIALGACGCDSTDSDNDGIFNCIDGCPNDPLKTAPGLCGCGVSDTGDADGDGVPDCTDQCPGVDDNVYLPDCLGSIPTASTWGLVVLALCLLTAAKLYFGRLRLSAD